jgi:hypothetical protein
MKFLKATSHNAMILFLSFTFYYIYRLQQNLVETKRYKVPRFAQATTSLVIVDPLQQLTDPLASSNGFAAYSSSSRQSYVANSAPKYVSTEAHVAKAVVSGERCMNKWAVGGILTTLFALVSVQSVVVGKQLIARINSLKTNKP